MNVMFRFMDSIEMTNHFSVLSFPQALFLYWELEGKHLPGTSHKYDIKRLEDHFKAKFMHQITPWDIKNYRDSRLSDGVKESTINREHTRITRVFNAFRDWKRQAQVSVHDFSGLRLPLDNPGEMVKKASEFKYRRNRVVTPEEFGVFCDYAHPKVRRVCTLAVLTLLRRKDIRLLKEENIDRALDQLSGTQSKTGLPYSVPATVTIKVAFNAAREEERDYICDFTNFRKLFERARKESQVYFQFRDLRRSGATELLLQAVDIRTIQKYLGHADLTMTQGYLNPPVMIEKEAAKKLEKSYTDRPEVDIEFCRN